MDILGTYKDEPVILQSKPQRRTISCFHLDNKLGYYRYIEDTYFLQFPYIIFCKYPFSMPNYSYLRAGFSPEPINSLNAKIYLPPLPNIYCCGTFPVCGCGGDNVKKSIQQFWQKRFKTGEVFYGEVLLCHMFGLLSSELDVDTALRQWETLDLVSFNERMIAATINSIDVIDVKRFLEMPFIASQNFHNSLELMF
jgi:hypothetical protein